MRKTILFLRCRFVNDVRLTKSKKSVVRGSVFLTEGGRSPSGVRKTGRSSVLAAFVQEIPSLTPPWGCCWPVGDSVSFGFADPHRNKTSGGYKIAPGRCGGCVLPFHCARAFWDGEPCVQYEGFCKEYPADASGLFSVRG